MNRHYELEKAKTEFKRIFNEDSKGYTLANTRHLKLVNQYGKFNGVVQKAKEYADLHLKLQSDSARCGVYLDDDTLTNLIRNSLNT